MRNYYHHMTIGNFGEILIDRDVIKFLKMFTDLHIEEIEKMKDENIK